MLAVRQADLGERAFFCEAFRTEADSVHSGGISEARWACLRAAMSCQVEGLADEEDVFWGMLKKSS